MATANTSEKTTLEKGFEKVVTPFQQFVQDQKVSSLLLVLCTIAALLIANSQLESVFRQFWETPLGFVWAGEDFSMSLRHWINEGLMTLFFFLIGMEMKREVLVGEIKDLRRFLPVSAAAMGGMLIPGVLYYLFNHATAFEHGWGIPMATDTAFAIGILALLKNHIPPSAFAFLTALAIIDDLGAILVIAVFYSSEISYWHLQISLLILGVLLLLNALGVRQPGIYFLLGVLIWVAMLGSGVHSTVAGVLVAMTVPARPKQKPSWFAARVQWSIIKFEHIEASKPQANPILAEKEQYALAEEMQEAAIKVTTPLQRWEKRLQHPVALFVMPVFALANAGIVLDSQTSSLVWSNTLAMGIITGLLLGKGLGIPLFTWLAIRSRLGVLPKGLTLSHVIGLGLLGGMGFTMSIFISGLGFSDNPAALQMAKTGILIASFVAAVLGFVWLRFFSKP